MEAMRQMMAVAGKLSKSVAALALGACAYPTVVAASAPHEENSTKWTQPPPSPNTEIAERRAFAGSLTYVFRASRFANLFYQVDCLAGLTPCSREAYEALWQRSLGGLADADNAALDSWKELRLRYSGSIERAEPSPLPDPGLPVQHVRRQIESVLRLSGYAASSLDDYASALKLLADPNDVERFADVLRRFEARFEPWWRTQAESLSHAMDGYGDLAKRADVTSAVESARRLYGPDLPSDGEQVFDLIARPRHESPDHGELVGSRSIIEVIDGERPEERFPVIMHELFHYWFATAPYAKRVGLTARFVHLRDPDAVAGYGLLDEVLATDLGNVVLARVFDPDRVTERIAGAKGLYGNVYIDAVARKALVAVERRLAAGGGPFDEDFVADYMNAVHAAFPKGIPPMGRLRPLVCLYDAGLKGAYDRLTEAAGSPAIASDSSFDPQYGREFLGSVPHWPLVVLMPTAHVETLRTFAPDIGASTAESVVREARVHPTFAFGARRASGSDLYVLVAPTDEDATKLVNALAGMDRPFDGLALRP